MKEIIETKHYFFLKPVEKDSDWQYIRITTDNDDDPIWSIGFIGETDGRVILRDYYVLSNSLETLLETEYQQLHDHTCTVCGYQGKAKLVTIANQLHKSFDCKRCCSGICIPI